MLIVDTGKARIEVGPKQLGQALRRHPPEVVDAVAARFGSAEGELAVAELRARLAAELVDVCSRIWADRVERPSGGEGYAFVAPPPGSTRKIPRAIGRVGPVMRYSAYRETPPQLLPEILANGTAALARFVERDFALALPSGDRESALRETMRDLGFVLEAAIRGPLVRLGPEAAVVPLPPGGVLASLMDTIDRVTAAITRVDLMETLVAPPGEPDLVPGGPDDDLETSLGSVYDALDEILRRYGSTVEHRGRELLDGTGKAWTIEGSRIRPDEPIDPLWDGGVVREHLVVPGLRPPSPSYGEELASASMPIVLILSDLHLGQASGDGAEDVSPALEAAFVEAIDAWAVRVKNHRERHLQAPAYLVLNGDILDFWSADVVPGTWKSDLVTTPGPVPGVGQPPPPHTRLTPTAARARMDRILAAHRLLFERIRRWVDQSRLNFLVYVAGNHDDHLVRYDLGAPLVGILGGDRGAFAAKTAHFPQLRLLIEHGHRSDLLNTYGARVDHGIGSLGELIVALWINPVERGGLAPFLHLEDQSGQPSRSDFLTAHGIDDDVADLTDDYATLAAARRIFPQVYDGIFREIDNLENGGAEDILFDLAASLAGRRKSDAAEDAFEAAGDAAIRLQRRWLMDDFQSFFVHVGRVIAPLLPPATAAWAVKQSFASDHSGKLGFDPASGLHHHRSMRVHVVGHTHRPSLTVPPLANRRVVAQHVNTGTGQDMWRAVDGRFGIDLFDLLSPHQDRLVPVDADQYCIVRLGLDEPPGEAKRLRIHVEGGSYRARQALSPMSEGLPVRGGLTPQGTNVLELP